MLQTHHHLRWNNVWDVDDGCEEFHSRGRSDGKDRHRYNWHVRGCCLTRLMAAKAVALRNGNVLLFVCSSVAWNWNEFTAIVSIDDQYEVLHGLFKEPILGPIGWSWVTPNLAPRPTAWWRGRLIVSTHWSGRYPSLNCNYNACDI